MPSPFPGMDPYLEGSSFWEEFHANLAGEIQAQLTPQLRPRYIAALTPRMTYEEITIQKTRMAIPDVGVFRVEEQPYHYGAVAIAPAPMIGVTTFEVPVKEQEIEIREVESGTLVTAIESLSPVNKRPGHDAYKTYRRKRRDLLRTDVHLLEIDLLRGGQRPPLETPLPDAPYFIFLSRGDWRPKVEIWPIKLSDALPIIPIPLLEPDPDVPLDLGRALDTIYDRAAYDLRIDYSQPPPKPELTAGDTSWLQEHLQAVGLR
jgi:hypothetical protein